MRPTACSAASLRASCPRLRSTPTTRWSRSATSPAGTHPILLLSRKHIASVRDVAEEDHDLIGKICDVGTELATREGIADDATGWSSTSDATAAKRSTTCTCTCSAAATWLASG